MFKFTFTRKNVVFFFWFFFLFFFFFFCCFFVCLFVCLFFSPQNYTLHYKYSKIPLNWSRWASKRCLIKCMLISLRIGRKKTYLYKWTVITFVKFIFSIYFTKPNTKTWPDRTLCLQSGQLSYESFAKREPVGDRIYTVGKSTRNTNVLFSNRTADWNKMSSQAGYIHPRTPSPAVCESAECRQRRLRFQYPSQHMYICTDRSKWAVSRQNQQYDCAPSEDSDQPAHPPSLVRVITVRMKKA